MRTNLDLAGKKKDKPWGDTDGANTDENHFDTVFVRICVNELSTTFCRCRRVDAQELQVNGWDVVCAQKEREFATVM